MKNKLYITYKNVAHAIELYNILKSKPLNYLQLGGLIPQADQIFLVELRVKKHPYCPMRSTWDTVKFNDKMLLSVGNHKTAYVSVECGSYYSD